MFTLKKAFLIAIFILIPLLGICQIDVPKWVDDIGGTNSNCISSSVQVDPQNNIYVTGFFSGTADFDPSAGVYNIQAAGTFDTFIAKYTTDGKLIWAESVGGGDYTQVNSMAVDKDGNVLISGQYDETIDADPGPGTYNLPASGEYAAFLIKLNTNGTFVWAKSIGGGETTYGSQVHTDSKGNVLEGVRYQGTATVGSQSFTAGGSTFNGLVIKYDPNGNLIWAVNIADTGDSEVFQDVDTQDNVIIGGHFTNTDNFNPLGTAHDLNGNGNSEFVAKYTSAGILVWIQDFGGALEGNNLNLCVDTQGDVFADGPFETPLNFNGTNLNPAGTEDIFVAKYSSTGVFQSVKDIGYSGSKIFNYGIHASQDNNVFISGYFSGKIDFDPSPATTAIISDHGQQDFFLAKYDNDLNYKWAFNGGSPTCSQSLGRNTTIDNNNDVIFTGGFCSTVNFSASSCSPVTLTAQSVSSRDCFLGKYTQNTATAAAQITAFTVPQQSSPAVIDQTNLIITVTVPAGTNITALVPAITYTSGVTISPSSGQAENFTGGVTYTLTGNCSTLNYTVNVVVAPAATLLTICSGNTSALTGAIENPTPSSYLWQTLQGTNWVNAAGTNNIANYQTPALTNTGTTNTEVDFRRQITTSGVSTYDSYYDITVEPVLAGNLLTDPADSIFCTSGDPAVITGSTPTGGAGTYTYQWQSSTDGTTYANINGATAINYDPPVLTVTTYYKRIVTSGTCATSASNVITIKIMPPPSPPVNVTTYTCQNSSVTVTITGQTGITYNWYDTPAKTNLLYTGLSYTTPPITQNTTYYIEAFNGTCSATSLATAQVNITPAPAAPTLVSNPIQTCAGTPATFTISNPQQGFTYNWYADRTGGTPIFTGTSYTIANPLESDAYFVDASNQSLCVSATRTEADITVIPLPPAPQVDPPTALCSGSPETLTITSPQIGLVYRWYDAATGGTLLATGNQYTTPILTSTTTYYAEAASSTGGCPSAIRTAVVVTVTQTPIAPASGNVQVCPGSPATITITDAVTGVTYNWYDSTAKNNLLFTGTTYVTGNINANTTYYVEAVNGSCIATTLATFQVILDPIPAAPIVNSSGPTCSGTQVTLTIANPQTGDSYNWYTTSTGGTASGSGVNFVTPALSQSTAYFAEAVNSNGCASSTRTEVDISVAQAPDISAQSASTCPNTSAVLSAQSLDANTTINWYASATGGSILHTGTTFTTPVLTATTSYYAEAVDNTTQCVSTQRAVATASILVQLSTPVVTVENTSPTQVTFQWAAVSGAAAYKVSTDNGETFVDPSSGPDGLSTTISGLSDGQSVTIIVEAIGSYSCENSAQSGAVTAVAQYPQNDIIYVANAFTPNGDGKNDVVYVHGNGIQSMIFHVYDQFGELIFTSSSLTIGWNGTYKGTIQPVGVYVYYVVAQMYNGQKISKKGTITLLK